MRGGTHANRRQPLKRHHPRIGVRPTRGPEKPPSKKIQPTEHPVVAPDPGGVSTLEEDRRRPADAARTEINSQQNLPADPENRVTGEPVKLPAQPKLLQPANLTERKTFVGDSPE